MGLGGNGDIQQHRRFLPGPPEIGWTRDQTPDKILHDLEPRRVEQAGKLFQMMAANMSPTRFGCQGLEEPLEGNKPLGVQYHTEFVRPMAKEVGEYLGQIFQLAGEAGHGWDWVKTPGFSCRDQGFLINV